MKKNSFQWHILTILWGVTTAYAGIPERDVTEEEASGKSFVAVWKKSEPNQVSLEKPHEEVQLILREKGATEEEIQDALQRTHHLFETVSHLNPEDQEKMLTAWNDLLQKQEQQLNEAEELGGAWELIEAEKRQNWYDGSTEMLNQAAVVISEAATKERLLRFVILATQCAFLGQATLTRCLFNFTISEATTFCGKKLSDYAVHFLGLNVKTFTAPVQAELLKLWACLMTHSSDDTKSIVEAAHAIGKGRLSSSRHAP